MSVDSYNKLRRFFSFCIAISLWIMSNIFSVNGFNFTVKDMAWAGWVMSLTITTLELVFNGSLSSKNKNLTLYFFGAIAYFYGMISNFIGIWLMGHDDMNNLFANLFTFVVVVVLAVMAETIPEALFVYALGIDVRGEGDFFKNLLKMQENTKDTGGRGNYQEPAKQKTSNDNYQPVKQKQNNTGNQQQQQNQQKKQVGRPPSNNYNKNPEPFVVTNYPEPDVELPDFFIKKNNDHR